jgi:hypothetical protein
MQIKEDISVIDGLLTIASSLLLIFVGIAGYLLKKLFDIVLKLKSKVDELYGEHKIHHKDDR